MLNAEKFKKEILDIVSRDHDVALRNGYPCSCSKILNCDDCDLKRESCTSEMEKWLCSEYVQPISWNEVEFDSLIAIGNTEGKIYRHFLDYDDLTKRIITCPDGVNAYVFNNSIDYEGKDREFYPVIMCELVEGTDDE